MELTGKCKEDFEKWYNSNVSSKSKFPKLWEFNYSIFPMQYGVYVDFFESKGIYILINTLTKHDWIGVILEEDIMSPYFESCEPFEFSSRKEVEQHAIVKANEIYNDLNSTK